MKRVERLSPDEWRAQALKPVDTSKLKEEQEREFQNDVDDWDYNHRHIGGLAQLTDKYISEGCDEDGAFRQAQEDRAGRPTRKNSRRFTRYNY